MKPTIQPVLPLLSFLLCTLWLVPCMATTMYVSNSGNNGNSGNSWAQAWLTLQYAADHVSAGDSVWIANGSYAGFDLRTSGTVAAPIVFIAAGENVIINSHNPVTMDGINVENADYIEIKGVRVINQPRNGIRLVYANNCIVRNTFCDNNQKRGIFTGFTDDILIENNECLHSIDEHGIYVSNSSDRSVIRYNRCHHNRGGGIQINADIGQGGDGISTDPEIYGNILYENGVGGGAAINLDGAQGAFIYNNLLYENHASGIALFQQDAAEPSINAVIVHNTIVNASNARWCILAVNGSAGAQVFNNIIINQHPWKGSIALDPDAVPGFDSDYNILVNSLSNQGDGQSMTLAAWQGLGYDSHSLLAAPLVELFVAPGAGNYHLLLNAQAVNAGNGDFSFGIDEDIEGTARPQGGQYDMGAYESQNTLGINDEEETPVHHHRRPDIHINAESISWTEGITGTLTLLNIEGKMLARLDISSSGEYSLQDVVPGVYVLALVDDHMVKWSKTFIRIGH